jgi:hypothetical protein
VWYTHPSIIPAFWKLRQDFKFEASLEPWEDPLSKIMTTEAFNTPNLTNSTE